jgi:alpha-galactosidase
MPDLYLDQLELRFVIQGWERAKANRGVSGGPLAIAGRRYERGVGTHTVSTLDLVLDGQAEHFRAEVGVDDAVGARGQGRARFRIEVDGRMVADSGVRSGGETAVVLEAELRGARRMRLIADAPGDNTHHGHANWADARIQYAGAEPRIEPPERGEPIAALPPPDPAPRFFAQPVLGARPGRWLNYRIPCLGAEDTVFECDDLPSGLSLDAERGILSGFAPGFGCWPIPVRARNASGAAATTLLLRVGSQALAPLPPLGWCSWNAYGADVTQADVEANHRALVAHGLDRYGYRWLNIDDGWQGQRRADTVIPWALQPNEKFPDLPALTREIHASGLLAGIYSVPGLYSPQGLAGGSSEHPDGSNATPFEHGQPRPIGAHQFFQQDVQQWAAWGFDWLKLDNGPPPWVIRAFSAAMEEAGRDFVFSLSARIPLETLAEVRGLPQLWRTTGDLIDTWPSVRAKLWSQLAYVGQGGPGGWNDCDMLVVGEVGPGWNAERQPSRLSWREQALHIGMWSFLASPLLLGCDLTRLDAPTRDLLTRPGLVALNQDPLGAPAVPLEVDRERGLMRWIRPLADGGLALAMVNLGDEQAELSCDLAGLGRSHQDRVTDCWTECAVETDAGRVCAVLAPHAHRLYRVWPGKP